MALCLLGGGAMTAHTEGFARELRQAVPVAFPVIGPAEREAGLDAFLERRGTRRVIAAQTHAPQSDARSVEIGTRHHVVDDSFHRDLVVAANAEIVLAFALPRPVEDESRNAACEIRPLVGLG